MSDDLLSHPITEAEAEVIHKMTPALNLFVQACQALGLRPLSIAIDGYPVAARLMRSHAGALIIMRADEEEIAHAARADVAWAVADMESAGRGDKP